MIDELGKRVFEEMDYLNEASNAEKFRKLHQHNPNIAVPIIYKHATARRILTMEWIDGVKLTNLNAVKGLGIDPNEMVEIGVNCSLQQLLEHGFFHADPHPGNLLALSDGRLCYLDFGMMSEVTNESRTGLIQAVVHLVNKNFNKLSKDFVKLGFLSEEVDLTPIIPAFEKIFTNTLETGVNKIDFKSVTNDMSDVMYKFPFRVPPYYALIIRSLITLEGIALSVDPDFKILGASYPYFAKRLMEDPDPQLRQSLKEMIFEKENLSWNKFEDLMKSAGSQSDLKIEILIDNVLDFLLSKNGGILRKEIVNNLTSKIDSIGWNNIKKFNRRAHSIEESLKDYRSNNKFDKIISIKRVLTVIKNIPGFRVSMIIKRLPRIILEPEGRKMGKNIAKGLTEKSMVRIIKIVAGATR